MAKRKVYFDRRVRERIERKQKAEVANEEKEKALDEAHEAEVPDDGIDHMRWPPEARKLALLLLDPANAGKTQAELGQMCGYSLRSVQRYMGMPEFKKYVNQIANRIFDDEADTYFRRSVLAGLKRGEFKFVELYAKMRGMLKEVRKVESDVNINDGRKDNADDLAEIERLRKEIGMDGEVKH